MFIAGDILILQKMHRRQILIIETKMENQIFNTDSYFNYKYPGKITILPFRCMIGI
jgi:hypothetical protein